MKNSDGSFENGMSSSPLTDWKQPCLEPDETWTACFYGATFEEVLARLFQALSPRRSFQELPFSLKTT